MGLFQPELVISELVSWPLPLYFNRYPYIGIVILFLITVHWYYNNTGFVKNTLSWSYYGLLVSVLVWAVIEKYHSSSTGADYNINIIAPYFWLFAGYMALCSFSGIVDDLYEKTVSIMLVTIFLFVAYQLFSYMISFVLVEPVLGVYDYPIWFYERPGVTSLGRTSYFSAAGIMLLIFIGNKIPLKLAILFMLAFLLLLAINQTRGAILVVLVLFALKIYELIVPRLKNKNSMLKVAAISGVFFLMMFSVVHLLMFSGEQDLLSIVNLKDLLDESSSIRIKTIILVLLEVIEHPYAGIGIEAVDSIKINGLFVHTNYVRILGAYGLIGFVFWLSWILSVLIKSNLPILHRLAVLTVLFGLSMFSPYLDLWSALLLYILLQGNVKIPPVGRKT